MTVIDGSMIRLVLVAVAIVAFAVVAARMMTGAGRASAIEGRPWYLNPPSWLGVSAVLMILGLFVAPALFGGAFFVLPLIMVGGRRRTVPRCRQCGASLRGDFAYCPRCGARVETAVRNGS
ncbi:MAG TPA: hypothetical protein VGB83_04040 [Actinomycetota bacterium]